MSSETCMLNNSEIRECELQYRTDGTRILISTVTDAATGKKMVTVTEMSVPDNEGHAKAVTKHADGSKTTNKVTVDTNNQIVNTEAIENDKTNTTMYWVVGLIIAIVLYIGTKNSSKSVTGASDSYVGGCGCTSNMFNGGDIFGSSDDIFGSSEYDGSAEIDGSYEIDGSGWSDLRV